MEIDKNTLVKHIVNNGGSIHPIIIPSELTNGTAIFNPAIFVDGNDLMVNLRHCQYSIYHSEFSRFEHRLGPLLYLNPENDITLTTTNYFVRLNEDLSVKTCQKVDTSQLDVPPLWEFIGLEDARLVRWDNTLYMIGVRRDTTTNGVGRMEFSEIEITDTGVREIKRSRIAAPGLDNTYCEKNWMPIIDKPFHFVKWTNPTEIVKVSLETNSTEIVETIDHGIRFNLDQRGGSHVIPFNDGYLAITHEAFVVRREGGKKNADYTHRFIYWDKDFKNMRYSDSFSLMNARVEFVCGMAEYNNELLITFGFQDNAAFILRTPKALVEGLLNA